MSFSACARRASAAFNFSPALWQASALPRRACDISAFSRGSRARSELSRSNCACRSSGGGWVSCKVETFFSNSRSAASLSERRRSTRRQFLVTTVSRRFGGVALFHQRALFLLELGERGCLLFGILLALRLDLLERFLDFRNLNGDFFLFLLQLFQRDDFVADLGEIDRLRRPSRPSAISLFCRRRFSCASAMRLFCRRTLSVISRSPVEMKLTG